MQSGSTDILMTLIMIFALTASLPWTCRLSSHTRVTQYRYSYSSHLWTTHYCCPLNLSEPGPQILHQWLAFPGSCYRNFLLRWRCFLEPTEKFLHEDIYDSINTSLRHRGDIAMRARPSDFSSTCHTILISRISNDVYITTFSSSPTDRNRSCSFYPSHCLLET